MKKNYFLLEVIPLKTNISLKVFFNSLSTALDFTYSGLSGHHRRVAYMAVRLGEKLRLPDERIKILYMSSIIHDIGAITLREKNLLADLEIEDPFTHSEMGYHMVKNVQFLKPVSQIIKSHHDSWRGDNPSGLRGNGIPLESRIINAADRLDVLLNKNAGCILEQSEDAISRLRVLSGRIIDPGIFAELSDLASAESFWLDLDYQFLPDLLDRLLVDYDFFVNDDFMFEVSLLFARVIDSKSVFTHKHSRLVAAVAAKLALVSGLSQEDADKMLMAGLLHDLGKLSVPEEILEKPGKLSPEEFRIIKKHTYYTHRILDNIPGFDEINRWASFHHEKLDGSGYPFRLHEEDIPAGSRIMAVSDVFSALTEDRPYRKGLPRQRVVEILGDMSPEGLDSRVIKNLVDNYDLFEALPKYKDPLTPE